MGRNDALQALCREYLCRLESVARKYGLLPQLNTLIVSSSNNTCVATLEEVEMLSRCCNDERVSACGLTKLLGLSYRYCREHNIFDKIKRLGNNGTYSKVDAMLYEAEQPKPATKKKRIRHKKWTIV